MKILLVYPEYPDTFWSFKHALRFIAKKALHPPLGLLTVAAMLPSEWEKRLIDMNTARVKDRDLQSADYVFIGGMAVQRESAKELITRCRALHVKTVAGGPLFTAAPDDFPEVDHLVLNEAENTMEPFLEDLARGEPRHLYSSKVFPDLEKTPIPLWSLIKMKRYFSMNLQYSRGCPFSCEFCDITTLYGNSTRAKGTDQIVGELDALYDAGWRGGVFFVDDNFIGNKRKLKEHVLPAMIDWMKRRRYPFDLATEASINLADDEKLMRQMIRAGFESVFIGIETPDDRSLKECNKSQNTNRDLVASVKRIQQIGLRVRGGFIVGFDNDGPDIFERQIKFVQDSRIVTAMVGMLNAPGGSRLYERLRKEGRLGKADYRGQHRLYDEYRPRDGVREALRGLQTDRQQHLFPRNILRTDKGLLQGVQAAGKEKMALSSPVCPVQFPLSRCAVQDGCRLGHQGRWPALLLETPLLVPLPAAEAFAHGNGIPRVRISFSKSLCREPVDPERTFYKEGTCRHAQNAALRPHTGRLSTRRTI